MALSNDAVRYITQGLGSNSAANELISTIDGLTDGGIATTDLDLGASGTAGSLDIFPTTASTGKLRMVAAANAGDTTTTITNASQTTTGIMTIPDTNGNASFVMTAAAQVLAGVKTFSVAPVFTLGWTTTTTGPMTVGEGGNFVLGTGTGTKIGTATAQKLGFWNATPIIQPASADQAVLNAYGAGANGLDSGANMAALHALVVAMRLALVNAGIIKGGA